MVRAYAWAVIVHLPQRYFSRPSTKDVVYGTTLLLLFNMLNAVRKSEIN